jgi:hypothetical protein
MKTREKVLETIAYLAAKGASYADIRFVRTES